MMNICLQCGHHFNGKFCPNCGQAATVKRLSATVLLEEILHFFTHLENGFVYTTWNFLIRPGKSAMEFIAGKRKNYQKPVSYFLIWVGLYIVLHNSIINFYDYRMGQEVLQGLSIKEQSNVFFRQHLSLFIIPVILVSALWLYIFLARPRFNFVELLAICMYGTGTYFMMSLFSDLVIGVVFRNNILTLNVFFWQAILSSCYNLWFSYDVFKRLHLRFFWLRLISVSLLVAVSGWLIMIYFPVLWIDINELLH